MTINEGTLDQARNDWGLGILKISEAYESSGIDKARVVANEFLDNLYGFEFGPVLFKPTLSGGSKTFRPSKEGALSYFIGENLNYPNDTGFGIKYWRKVDSDTSAIFIEENIAMWIGWVTLVNNNGDEVKVDKSWGYRKDDNGRLKIVLHHSSLPYEA
tara:strand:+ start:71 stop:544 length:474 start_codon:yes stop_codon:yes gene_type:complete